MEHGMRRENCADVVKQTPSHNSTRNTESSSQTEATKFLQGGKQVSATYEDPSLHFHPNPANRRTQGANVGEIIGLFINGFVSERYGYRYTVMACLTLIIGFTAIFFTAQSVIDLQVAEILCGIPWGVFQTLTITYASEVCPVALRGYLTTYVNFCWGLGQTIGIGVIKSQLGRTDEWAYRIPYALQWMWPVPLLIGVLLAPESPWWLVRKGRTEDAKKALLRLTSLNRETNFDADETIAMMVHTTALEEKVRFPPLSSHPSSPTSSHPLFFVLTNFLLDHKRSNLPRLFPRHRPPPHRNRLHGLGHPKPLRKLLLRLQHLLPRTSRSPRLHIL